MAREVDCDMVIDAVLRHLHGPFQWGVNDCCTSAANVARDLCGVDLMERYRGRYSSRGEARALIRSNGGLGKMLARAAREAGWVRSSEPGALANVKTFYIAVSLGLGWWAHKGYYGVDFSRGDLVGWRWAQ